MPAKKNQQENPHRWNTRKNKLAAMTKITEASLPEPVARTLKVSDNKGWESGKLYKTKEGDMYVVEVRTGGKAQQFRFGPNGNEFKDF